LPSGRRKAADVCAAADRRAQPLLEGGVEAEAGRQPCEQHDARVAPHLLADGQRFEDLRDALDRGKVAVAPQARGPAMVVEAVGERQAEAGVTASRKRVIAEAAMRPRDGAQTMRDVMLRPFPPAARPTGFRVPAGRAIRYGRCRCPA
jgi:hypothetical protein